MRWFGVQPDEIRKWQPEVTPFIRTALEAVPCDFTPLAIFERCRKRKMQLWLIEDQDIIIGAVVTFIDERPLAKIVRIFICAGERLDEWLPMIGVLEAWGRKQGCTAIEPAGRLGWAKKLEPFGYKVQAVMMRKLLYA